MDTGESLANLSAAIDLLRGDLLAAERAARLDERGLHPAHRLGAANLVHYLALRRHDIRELQAQLARLGLSSLGRAEAHVLASVEQVGAVLAALAAGRSLAPPDHPAAVTYDEGRLRLDRNAEAALGPEPAGRTTRILVTLPSAAAVEPGLAAELIARGMDCARINCAHDGPAAWAAMVANVRAAASAAGRPCPIEMDLGGPKLRTAGLDSQPGVVKVRPARDRFGRVTAPGELWLLPAGGQAPAPEAAWIPVPGAWLAGLRRGDQIRLRDARGKRRQLHVAEVAAGRARLETESTAYLVEGTELGAAHGACAVAALPPATRPLVLRAGDRLTLAAAGSGPRRIGCTLPEVIDDLRPGQRVWFDDGKIGCVVVSGRPGEAELEVTAAARAGTRLRAEKGINLPDTDIDIAAVTPQDEAVLPFVAAHADLVGLSFVRRAADIRGLQERLARLGAAQVGLVLKIETAEAFTRLPELMLAAMADARVAVMIARGDLAVECGWERLAEVQEEILWLAEAAHLPVIWATQVLDTLARTGQPSRAEITDAAMSQRAECVMLNKGPYILTAVATLDDILYRMSGHQEKKSARLRQLQSWPSAWAPP